MIAGLVIGLYSMAPGFYLGGLQVKRGAEVVDHVAPGLVVLTMVFIAIRWGAASLSAMVIAGVVVLLAGLWMVATHVGLFRQGIHHQAAWGPVAYHCSTAVLVFLLGVAWVYRYRKALSA